MDDCFISTSTAWHFLAVVVVYYIVRWLLWQLTVGNYDKKYVLITGCDKGFGNLLARQLLSMGFNVFAGCLTENGISDLQEVGSKKLNAFLLNVTKKEDIEKSKKYVKSLLPKDTGLWALVNNAGILGYVAFPDCFKREHYEKVLDVNMYGTIEMTTAFLPLLREAKGRIVNVSSVAGIVSLASCIPYTISKYAVEAFSDGLRYVTHNQNVSVHMLEPGLHGTDILNKKVIKDGIYSVFNSAPQEVQDYYGEKSLESYIWSTVKLMSLFTSSKLQNVINAHVHAITAKFPKARYLIGYDANLFFWPVKVLPHWISDALLKARFSCPIGAQKKKIS